VKAVLAWFACTTLGCGFHSVTASDDAGVVDVPVGDAAADAPIDVELPTRTRDGLIGLWEFDETSGTRLNDTSDTPTTSKVPLDVTMGEVVFAPGTGTMTVPLVPITAEVVIQSNGDNEHLNDDVLASRAVTLEAWVMPAVANQGSDAAPVVVAGLSSNAMNRNISIMQAGNRWLARVRTGLVTFDVNGLPDLSPMTVEIVAGAMTHLVVVSDATQRILYVDGKEAISTAPAPPAGWDAGYRMVLGNERNNNRAWAGTFALVAMYNRALTPALIDGNYRAGPNWKAP
jgi:hypothetical protein